MTRSFNTERRLGPRFPSFARIHFPIISRRRPGDIWIVWYENTRANCPKYPSSLSSGCWSESRAGHPSSL